MSSKHVPRNGPSRALWEAPPDTEVEDIPRLLDDVPRYQCDQCGTQRFARPVSCGECDSEEFTKVEGRIQR
jgi:uncharacterized OB-fold protein